MDTLGDGLDTGIDRVGDGLDEGVDKAGEMKADAEAAAEEIRNQINNLTPWDGILPD